jgi:HK97 family phage prohead protease
MQMISERRYSIAQIRSTDAGAKKKVLRGLAARFGVRSENLGGFKEVLRKGCFKRSLASGREVMMLSNHDAGKPLGRRSNNTLRLRESEDGLEFDCDLNMDTSFGRDAYAACLRGDWKEMSFGFTVPDGGDQWDDDWDDEDRSKRIALRTVNDCDLAEISCVGFPAYSGGKTAVNAGDGPMAFMAARSLWPSGTIPVEIRSRVRFAPSSRSMSDEERWLYTQALLLETLGQL